MGNSRTKIGRNNKSGRFIDIESSSLKGFAERRLRADGSAEWIVQGRSGSRETFHNSAYNETATVVAVDLYESALKRLAKK